MYLFRQNEAPAISEESKQVDWKQWEGHVIDGKFHLIQYVAGSAHNAVFSTECGAPAPHPAAIRLVKADSTAAQTWMLRRELAARLSHPGLLPLFHFGECQLADTHLTYAVMEQAEENLSQVIPGRPLDPAEVREILDAVIGTLTYLHAEGFVHGCLTPANIVAVGDRIKISSDALLRTGESSGDLCEPNPNGPPEGRAGLTPASDVWSIGMLLVETLTQRPPAWDGSAAADPVVPEQLPAPFLAIARRCLRADPRLRCSLNDIALVLHPPAAAPQHRLEIVPPAPAPKPAAPEAPWRRQYLLPAAVAGVVLGALVCTGVVLTHARVSAPAAVAPPATPDYPVVVAPKPAPFSPRSTPAGAPRTTTKPAEGAAPQPAPATPAAYDSGVQFPAPDVVNRALPEVPREIMATIRGVVQVAVRVRVDQSGAVVDAQLASPPGSRYFDRVTLEAARHWTFQPAASTRTGPERARLVRFECRPEACQASAAAVQP